MEDDGTSGLREACGVFGCIKQEGYDIDVAHAVYMGLIGLQHRGQESAGIVTSDGKSEHFRIVRDTGLVNVVFNENSMNKLGKDGVVATGHTRYSTAGLRDSINCIQPFVVYTLDGIVAISHNGELVNAHKLRQKLLRKGIGLSTDTDSELIAQLLAHSEPTANTNGDSGDEDCESTRWIEKIRYMMNELSLAYSLVIMTKTRLFAVRDAYGNRPLCYGKVFDKDKNVVAYVVGSETCSFNAIDGAKYEREIDDGEILELTTRGEGRSVRVGRDVGKLPAFCIFEYVYFAKSDSCFSGGQVYNVRYRCGIQLAKEAKVDADLVSTVPDSATPAAHGYSFQTGIPYMDVLSKNSYVGRSFIQPSKELREKSVKKKFGPLSANFNGKRVVLIDDSIVRGTTMRQIVKLLMDNGAAEVHIRVASPEVRFPCYMGINIPTREELIANKLLNNDDMKNYFGATSVRFLTIEGLVSVVENRENPKKAERHCVACLNGKYPVDLSW